MRHANINSILEDHHGHIWMGTFDGGLTQFDGNQFTHFYLEQSDLLDLVHLRFVDSKERIWLTSSSGFYYFIPEKGKKEISMTFFNPTNYGMDIDCYPFLEDNNGNIWFGSMSLCQFDGQQFTFFAMDGQWNDYHIMDMEKDDEGNLWFATKRGLTCLKMGKDGHGDSFMIYPDIGQYDWASRFTTLKQDNYGRLWIGTFANGIKCLDGQQLMAFTTQQGLSHNHIRMIFEDSAQNIWIATAGGGLNRYNPKRFHYLTETEVLDEMPVRN